MRNKIWSFLMTVCILVGLIPVTLFAENFEATENIEGTFETAENIEEVIEDYSLGQGDVSNPEVPVNSSQQWTGSYVFFGDYERKLVEIGQLVNILGKTEFDESGYAYVDGTRYQRIRTEEGETYYYECIPIRWQVLHVNEDEMLLLSEKIISAHSYDERTSGASDIKWENSSLRDWLKNDFYSRAFDSSAQNAVLTKTISNETGTELSGGGDTQDKVFVLSKSDMMNPAYGFWGNGEESETRTAQRLYGVDITTGLGLCINNFGEENETCYYWTRTPYNVRYDFLLQPVCVTATGSVAVNNLLAHTWKAGIRPAVYISKSSKEWSTELSVKGVYLSQESVELQVGDSKKLNAAVIPSEYVEQTVQWESSNPDIAEVDESGTITALKNGTATIAAIADNGVKGNVKVYVGIGEESVVASPVASTAGGTYAEVQSITLTSATEGADIYYTIDGTEPSAENGVLYTGSIVVKDSIVLKAIAVKAGMRDSDVTIEKYEFSEQEKAVNLADLKIGENQDGEVKNEDALRFYPGNFSLKLTDIPFSASVTEEADGAFKLKISIGIGRADLLDSETSWNQYKKCVEDSKKNSDQAELMTGLLSAFEGERISLLEVDKFKKKPKLSAIGYYEMQVDKYGNIIQNSGTVALDAEWDAKMAWKFITLIGPMYLELAPSGKIEGELELAYELADGGLAGSGSGGGTAGSIRSSEVNEKIEGGKWKISGNLSLVPGISLEGGYGISKVATIGANGKAELPVQIVPASKLTFNAAASVHAYVVFVLDVTYDLATYKTTLWDTTSSAGDNTGGTAGGGSGGGGGTVWSLRSVKEGEFAADLTPVDRSYTEYTSEWQGAVSSNIYAARARAIDEGAMHSEQILQTGVMPNSLPMLRQIGDSTVMVYQANASEREVLDSSVLMYSVYDGGVWSEPQPVWDTGTSDLFADLQLVGEELYLVWQKENGTISTSGENGEAVLKEMAEKSEICFAKYNQETKKFEECQYITSDNNVDMLPKLVSNGEKITAVWISNTKNDMLQTEGTNQIVYAEWNNDGFGEKCILQEVTREIGEFVPFYENEELCIGYIAYDSEESGQTQVYLLAKSGEEKVISEEDSAAVNIQYSNGALYYLTDGILQEYSVEDDILTAIQAGESAIGANAAIHTNGEKTAIIWSSYNEEEGISYIYSSVKTENGFAEPVAVHQTEGVICYLASVLQTNNAWEFLMNTYVPDEEAEIHSFVFAAEDEISAVEIETVMIESAVQENGEIEFSYIVTNIGEKAIDKLLLTLTNESGLDIQQEIPVMIAPGETVYKSSTIILPELTEAVDANLSIFTEEQSSAERDTVPVTVGQTDLELETVLTETKDEICIAAEVTNNSAMSADAEIEIYGDVEQTQLIDTISVGMLSAGETKSYTFFVKKDTLDMNEAGAVYLPVVVESSQSDNNMANNTVVEAAYEEIPKPTAGKGDINRDGEVDLSDLMSCLHHVSGKEPLEGIPLTQADVDGNGEVNLTDLMRLQRYIAGASNEL